MEISDNLTLLIENMLCSTMHNSKFKWIWWLVLECTCTYKMGGARQMKYQSYETCTLYI